MIEKECFKCLQVLPLAEFYKHPQMADGHVNKCKTCNKRDVTTNRKKNVDYYREYDRGRGNRQDYDYVKEYRDRYPNKYKAHILVGNSIRSGDLLKEFKCSLCPSEISIVAHHDDYLKPLEVRWLCQACHVNWHKINGEGLNGGE